MTKSKNPSPNFHPNQQIKIKRMKPEADLSPLSSAHTTAVSISLNLMAQRLLNHFILPQPSIVVYSFKVRDSLNFSSPL